MKLVNWNLLICFNHFRIDISSFCYYHCCGHNDQTAFQPSIRQELFHIDPTYWNTCMQSMLILQIFVWQKEELYLLLSQLRCKVKNHQSIRASKKLISCFLETSQNGSLIPSSHFMRWLTDSIAKCRFSVFCSRA